ncbi:MAG: MBL fold metallo-hydrolase [Candidatus Nanopelagicales bacterium]
MRSLTLGDIVVAPLLDSAITVPGDELLRAGAAHFPVLDGVRGLDARDWAALPEHLDADGLFRMTFGGYLVRSAGRVVLVDVGVGPSPFAPPGIPRPYDGVLLESLAAEGLAPEDVTDVVLTHLHLDHIGWVSVDGAPVFPGATYRCAEQEWSAAAPPPVAELMGPVAERLETWDRDATILPGIDVRLAPGHTPGSTVVVVSSGGRRVFLVGDLAHCPHELLFRDWAGLGDADPVQAASARAEIAAEVEAEGAYVGSTHFSGLAMGRIDDSDGVRRFTYDVTHDGAGAPAAARH